MIDVSFYNMSKNTFTIDLEKLTFEEREVFFNLLRKGSPSSNFEPTLEEKIEVKDNE